ncbi:MAG: hypothetical protein CMH26_03015 [Micavibrio sp.]|nr:hypothetical protein [Micavibrio sp.]
MFKKLVLILPLITLCACESFTADRYISTSSNQAVLKNIHASSKYEVGPFTPEEDNSISVGCRMAGPIQVAGNGDHAAYIQTAFMDELSNAGIYKPNSSKIFSAKLKDVSVDTITPAKWTISGDFFMNDTLVKSVNTQFPFKTSYSAYGACNNAAENFPYAVEQFLNDFISSPEFQKSVR